MHRIITHPHMARPHMARPHVARPRVALALALALACAACSSGSATSVKNDAASAAGPQYVALGDSYTAGPDLAQTDGNSAACNRSLRNYPRLVSKKIDASLTDV
ncbi:MAG: hypothetical protein H7290_08280, partial [Flavobacterium sp.]|nr:hypothetical protein [Aeromicrobium sp.]